MPVLLVLPLLSDESIMMRLLWICSTFSRDTRCTSACSNLEHKLENLGVFVSQKAVLMRRRKRIKGIRDKERKKRRQEKRAWKERT